MSLEQNLTPDDACIPWQHREAAGRARKMGVSTGCNSPIRVLPSMMRIIHDYWLLIELISPNPRLPMCHLPEQKGVTCLVSHTEETEGKRLYQSHSGFFDKLYSLHSGVMVMLAPSHVHRNCWRVICETINTGSM